MPMFKLRRQKRHHLRATLLTHTGGASFIRPRARPVVVPVAPTPNLEELRRQSEIEQDMRLARDIQQGLLLEAVPRLFGWEISAVSLPARDIGGDLYDFLPFPDHWHGIMIGDVSGKGLPAALRMAVARTVFRHEARCDQSPGATLARTNRGVLSEIPQGMDDESEYTEISAVMHPCDTVVLYTDGVVEASGPNEQIYGYERLEHMLRTNAHLKPRALLAVLLHELRAWSGSEQADDITMVIIRRRLASLGAELGGIADDVLGVERSGQLWATLDLPSDDAPKADWAE